MNCPACRHDNAPEAKFCAECGARLPSACRVCGAVTPAGAKFCPECGAQLAAAPAAAAGPPTVAAPTSGAAAPAGSTATAASERFASPRSYTPKHLAEKILTSKAAVEGERKQVTVLFTDVSGFTAMSERLDPEEVHAIMDQAFEVILGAVHQQEGTVNQFLGDGVMALFGAPIAHEDHAQRALRAALAIQQNLKSVRDDVRRQHGLEFRMRIGVNTGLVVVGAIGRDLRMDYTAVGDTTNLAARLLNLAQPGQIATSEPTRRLTEGFFVFEDLGEFQVKGKSAPVRAFAVQSELRGRTRLEVSKERGLTPLAGRQEELHQLLELHARTEFGEAAVVLVTGEPGVGKSRLLYEYLRAVDSPGTLALETSCVSYGHSMAYHPILGLVRSALRLPEGTGESEVRERVRSVLDGLGLLDEESETLLLHFLGVAVQSEILVRLQGPQLKEHTFRLLTRMLLGAADRRLVVVVIENIHWADDSSLEYLHQLTENIARHRALVVLSTRPGPTVPWLAERAATIALEGLDPDDVRGMVQALVGVPRVAEPLVTLLLDKSAGNPLYVEEILRQLQETRALVVAGGEARLERAAIAVPATIHDIIAARVDRLAEPLKTSLQPASVVGRQFEVGLVATVVEDGDGIADRFARLHDLDFVFPAAREPELVYAFKHALTQEVVYNGLLERRRRAYHAAIAAALEASHAERLEDIVELLAYHYGRSAGAERAVDYAIRAGEKSQRRWATSEALAHFQSALKRLDTMPDTEENRRRRIDAVVKQSEIKFALGQHAEHVQALEAIRDIVKGADPPRRAAWLSWAGFLHMLTGASPSVSIAYCTEAAQLAESAGLEDMQAFAESCLAHVHIAAGDLRAARRAAEWALDVFEARGNLWWACRTLWALIPTLNAMGEWRLALGYCDRALAHATATDDVRLKVIAHMRRGTTEIQRGDVERGLVACEQAAALGPGPFDVTMLKAMRASGRIKTAELDAGITELTEAVTWFKQTGLGFTRLVFGLLLVDGHLRRGERAKAREVVEEMLATSRERGYRLLEGLAERLLAEALAETDPETPAEHFEAAARILESIGARNDLARVWTGQARLREAAGDHGGARALLERALAVFEELGTLDETARTRAALTKLSTLA